MGNCSFEMVVTVRFTNLMISPVYLLSVRYIFALSTVRHVSYMSVKKDFIVVRHADVKNCYRRGCGLGIWNVSLKVPRHKPIIAVGVGGFIVQVERQNLENSINCSRLRRERYFIWNYPNWSKIIITITFWGGCWLHGSCNALKLSTGCGDKTHWASLMFFFGGGGVHTHVVLNVALNQLGAEMLLKAQIIK